jgi:hypothetical protein
VVLDPPHSTHNLLGGDPIRFGLSVLTLIASELKRHRLTGQHWL